MHVFTAQLVSKTTPDLLADLVERNLLHCYAEAIGNPEFKLPGTIREVAIALIAAEEAQRWAQRSIDDQREATMFAPTIDEQGERDIWLAAKDLGIHLDLPSAKLLDRWLPLEHLTRVYYLEHRSRRGKLSYDEHLVELADVFAAIRNADDAIPEDWSRWLTDTHRQCIERAIYLDVNRRAERPEQCTKPGTHHYGQSGTEQWCIDCGAHRNVAERSDAQNAADIGTLGYRYGACDCADPASLTTRHVRLGTQTGTACICAADGCQRMIVATFIPDPDQTLEA